MFFLTEKYSKQMLQVFYIKKCGRDEHDPKRAMKQTKTDQSRLPDLDPTLSDFKLQ
jgi:hypothetical protein